jgi:predicted DsbA family dithiol-disulfide isomerase
VSVLLYRKRRIEDAALLVEDAIEIEWKSFQLDASFVASPDDNIFDHLAEKYRKDRDWAVEMVDNMTQNAKNTGLDFSAWKSNTS